ncbi:MAG: BamA/TamA family outer membrane protein [Deltaproteobacteria bacterium]|nr:BamA/TamA family outer membrane protein [Deltaproteobacteria bacterium]
MTEHRRLVGCVALAVAVLVAGRCAWALPADPAPPAELALSPAPTPTTLPSAPTRLQAGAAGAGGLDALGTLLGFGDVARADAACLGKPIAFVRFEGCPGTACEDPKVYTELASVVDLRPGRRLGTGELRLAWERLSRIGFFKSVQIRCGADAQGQAQVAFSVLGHWRVRRIRFAGNAALFLDELRSKLLIQPGDALDLDTVGGQERLQAQREAIEALYQRNGFDSAKIRVRAEPAGKGEFILWIDIAEGDRQRITEARFDLQPPPRRSEFEAHHGLTCPELTERAVRNAAALTGLDVFSQREANRIRARIRTYLRRQGYGSPRVEVHHETSDKSIRIDVSPGKCAIVRILVRDDSEGGARAGYQLQDDRALYDSLPFGDSGLYDFAEAERGRQDLLLALENRGYLFADVRLDYRPVPAGDSGQVTSAITYWAATGYVSQVRGIFFHAVDKKGDTAAMPDSELRKVISTRAYDFFDAGGYLQVDQVLADLDLLRNYFVAQGFWEFNYALTLPAGVTPTAANRRAVTTEGGMMTIRYRFADKGFWLRKPSDENFIYLDISYRQGEPSRLRSLRVVGAQAVPESEVRALWPIDPGQIVSWEKLERALSELESSYRNNGFFRSQVKLWCASAGPDRPMAECARETLLARHVDVELRISEGERVDFGESFVIGNFNTDAEVITRDLPRAGVPYSAALEFESQRRLRNLGLFSQVTFARVGDDEKPPRRRLATVVRVVEEQVKYWEALIGFQTINTARNAYERESIAGFKEVLDHATTATDRSSMGYGRAQHLTLPNLLATAEGAYVDKNFARSGKLLRIAAKLGLTVPPSYDGVCVEGDPCAQKKDAIVLAPYSDTHKYPPWWSDTLRYAAASITYQDPRFFGSDFGLRWVVPSLVHDYALSVVDTDKVGSLVELSRRFGRLLTAVSFDYGLVRLRAAGDRDRDFENSSEWMGLRQQVMITPSLSYDNTDSPLNPRQGLSLQLSLPYINGYVKDSTDTVEPYKLANMVKWEGTGRIFLPVGDSLVLAMMVHGGLIYGFGEAKTAQLPQNVTFRLGGQYPQTLLRGYADFGIRQYADEKTVVRDEKDKVIVGSTYAETDHTVGYGKVVANSSVEVRFPVLRDLKVNGTVFWDFGALADDAMALAQGVRHGVGGSLVWLVAGQIPLRADLAFPVGALRCIEIGRDQKGVLGCVDEERFQFNAALMYSF